MQQANIKKILFIFLLFVFRQSYSQLPEIRFNSFTTAQGCPDNLTGPVIQDLYGWVVLTAYIVLMVIRINPICQIQMILPLFQVMISAQFMKTTKIFCGLEQEALA